MTVPSTTPRTPRVAVLMPTYRGAAHLDAQITSILDQQGVEIQIFAHDDGSDDGTRAMLDDAGAQITVLEAPPTGGAAQNVFFLLQNAPVQGFDFVALADQDDIWLPDKLARGVAMITQNALDGFGSDVLAFWPDGRTRYLRKSWPAQPYDHFFEAGSPGNTHVYPAQTARIIADALTAMDADIRRDMGMHDWLIYALIRTRGMTWMIDDRAALQYRQHDANVMGAAFGPAAVVRRVKLGFRVWYLKQIHTIAVATGQAPPFITDRSRSRLAIAASVIRHHRSLRRKPSEARMLAVILTWHLLTGHIQALTWPK